MEIKYSTSVNIIRDSEKGLYYIKTPNAERISQQIENDFKNGFHSFNIIGSYGTGKSTYLWALTHTLKGNAGYFDINLTLNKGKVKVLNFVGAYQSIIQSFSETLSIKNTLAGNQEIFDAIFQQYRTIEKEDGLLLIVIDELGKFLEYAAKHEPERELYFIQQLAEFANDNNRNILFISTLHQNFEAYAIALDLTQRKEWLKVKGRLKELPFNEPVEQLLMLAGKHLGERIKTKPLEKQNESLAKLNSHSRIFVVDEHAAKSIGEKIYPLELFSAYVLTLALQKYGQNERSLFTFLESSDYFGMNHPKTNLTEYYNLPNVYDYLNYNYYSFLHTKFNPHFTNWASMQSAIERAEAIIDEELDKTLQIIKTIGLLNLFARKSAIIDLYFLQQYNEYCLGIENTSKIIKKLESRKIIRFNKFSNCYKLIEGTDLDIDAALIHAESKVDEITDVVGALNDSFKLPFLIAKSISYLKGTPRNFEFIISDHPVLKTPKGAIDGYINLIFNDQIEETWLVNYSRNINDAILYGYFQNIRKIKELLYEIQKTGKVLAENLDDQVAKKELKIIIEGQKNLLNHYVLDDLYSNKITWIFKGEKQKVENKKQFNRLLSKVCDVVYHATPVFRNELVNKHKIPGNIHLARRMYFEALVNHWNKQDLGFDFKKFPPEKTIYLTLLKQNQIHCKTPEGYELLEPDENSSFKPVWNVCEKFLDNAKYEKKKITDLYDILSERPFKLKQGLIGFWVPTFLFIKRGDYALYGEGKFSPYVNESILYLITRNPHKYDIKAFEITEVRLKLFNKYREFLKQKGTTNLSNKSFIESVRPFLIFYRNLPEYCKKTQQLSKEAKAFRNAIVNAQDPEKVFFEKFPSAFEMSVEQLANSDEALATFSKLLNNTVKEIKNAYIELINRIEKFIQDEIIGKRLNFVEYKSKLSDRFSSIKDHKLLSYQKVFLQRINSPIDDRDSWISSISQAILQKPLDQISDKEEKELKNKLLYLIKELDNLREISHIKKDENEVLKFEITTFKSGLKSRIIEIPKGKINDIEEVADNIRKLLDKNENVSVAVLAKLLDEKLNNE